MQYIDLNCDMGEGMDTDEAIMPFISSANVACGKHAGDLETMQQTIDWALEHGVAIGAHPGFDDRANFGRTNQQLSDCALYDLVAEQLQTLQDICFEMGTRIHHVKPHGALYNMAAKDATMSRIIAEVIKELDSNIVLYGLSNSLLISEAKVAGLRVGAEVFADRTYQDDGSLTPRTAANALITDAAQSMQQVMQLIQEKMVQTVSGKMISLPADTICIHGDGAHAVEFAQNIHHYLTTAGIGIRPL